MNLTGVPVNLPVNQSIIHSVIHSLEKVIRSTFPPHNKRQEPKFQSNLVCLLRFLRRYDRLLPLPAPSPFFTFSSTCQHLCFSSAEERAPDARPISVSVELCLCFRICSGRPLPTVRFSLSACAKLKSESRRTVVNL